jgi:tetraacyldisaccharide 4'-kinase
LNLLSAAYGTGARLRRAWYRRHPERVRRLSRPVISVGNLAVGGSGKTPIVAAIARLLREQGERPVVLSRGYARRDMTTAIVIVSDGKKVLEPVTRSGDEPQMLARDLAGVPIVVGADRYEAGRMAESTFDTTVFVLDDGFQHVQLGRDVDLLVVSEADLGERLLPAGRLREPLSAAAAADALLVYGDADEASRVARALDARTAFTVARHYGTPRAVTIDGGPEVSSRFTRGRVVAVAGIARPERFFTALRAHGFDVVREMRFRDHHWFSDADLARIADASRETGADAVITTEKDAMRITTPMPGDVPVGYLPMRVSIDPALGPWLASRLHQRTAAR